jgi:hypothetical protein
MQLLPLFPVEIASIPRYFGYALLIKDKELTLGGHVVLVTLARYFNSADTLY